MVNALKHEKMSNMLQQIQFNELLSYCPLCILLDYIFSTITLIYANS